MVFDKLILAFIVSIAVAQGSDATLRSNATLRSPSVIYHQPVSTKLGCECKINSCTTSVLFECDAAPFCEVKSQQCAHGTAYFSFSRGYYDYCVYKPYDQYENRKASEKKDIVMAHIKDGVGTSGKYPSTLGVLTGIMGESVMVSFDASADVFPERRTKYIHGVGTVGGIKFVSTRNHAYGGLFQGADYGLIRLSSAKQPGSGGTAPGMGIKFFRDGRPSANFVAMYSLDGQPCSDKSFFAHDWSNHISTTDNFGLKLIAAKFWQASYCPLMVGLSDLASNSDGSQGKFPYRLFFHALVDVDCPCQDYDKCLSNLAAQITEGTPIFEVRAQENPSDTLRSLIGHIVLTDAFARSAFGDNELFFKHQHMEDDFHLQPEWLKLIDRKQVCGMGCAGTAAPAISKGCSSPFNSTEKVEMMLSDDPVVV